MECPFVPYNPATTVRPRDILLQVACVSPLLKTATFGNDDADLFAAQLVAASQACDEWVLFPVYHAPTEVSIVPAMIAAELVEEKRDGDRWLYSLTPKAIEHLYESQKRYVPPQAPPLTWWQRLQLRFMGMSFPA